MCPICVEPLHEPGKAVLKLKCSHSFHAQCFQGNRQAKCPLCRKEHNVICLTDETPCDDCGNNLNSYPDGIIILSCKHVFHARCFMEEAQRPTCNVCREEVRFLLRTADDTMYGHHLASSDSDAEDAMRMRLIQDEMARLPSCIDCNPAWPHWYCYSCHAYTSRPT